MNGKVTWNDLHNATFKDLKKTYKLTDRQLEGQVRQHMDGIKTVEQRSDFYKKVYEKKD